MMTKEAEKVIEDTKVERRAVPKALTQEEVIAAAKAEIKADEALAMAKAAELGETARLAAIETAKTALGPHTASLDALVRSKKITPAERKGIETSLAKGDTAGLLLAILGSRSAQDTSTTGTTGTTGPQVGAGANNPVLQYVEAQNALRSK